MKNRNRFTDKDNKFLITKEKRKGYGEIGLWD